MNTLSFHSNKVSDYENGKILIEDFRFYQHELIEYFLSTIVEYISNKNNNFLSVSKIVKKECVVYSGLQNNELDLYSVFVFIDGVEHLFFKIYMPRLIYNNFYILNGHYYVPLFYIIDKPIIIKENSINLSSLFSSITLNIKEEMVTFIGHNIVLNNFIQLFLKNDQSNVVNDIYNRLSIKNMPERDLILYFNNIFNKTFSDIDSIINHIEMLFFDEYTKYLYSSCYSDNDIEICSIKEIVKLSLSMFFTGKRFNFIDLNTKRLCFIELLLAPLFKKAANIAYQSSKGYKPIEIKVDQYIITKNFLKSSEKNSKKPKNQKEIGSFAGLSGKTLYDLVNLYSSILIHKCSFVKPGMNSPPPEIKNVHFTHFGKICPITVSSQDPGKTLSIIPETLVDIFGQFQNLEEGH